MVKEKRVTSLTEVDSQEGIDHVNTHIVSRLFKLQEQHFVSLFQFLSFGLSDVRGHNLPIQLSSSRSLTLSRKRGIVREHKRLKRSCYIYKFY